MKQNRIHFFQEILVIQANNLIFYPLAMTLVTLFSGLLKPIRPSLTVWLLCGLLPLSFYWARRRLNRFLSFLAVHLAVIGGLFAIIFFHDWLPLRIFQPWDNLINCAASLLSVTGFAIYSLYLRLHEQTAESNMLPMPLAVGITAGALYLQHYMGFREWDSYYKLTLILVLGMYFLHYYVKEYLNFLVVNASSTGVLPEKEIFHSGLILAFGYTLLGMLILFGTSQFAWLKTILNGIRQVIVTIIRFLSGLFPKGESSAPEIIVEEAVNGGGYDELPEPGEPALIWQILGVIVSIAVFLGILYLLFKGIVRLIAYVKQVMDRSVQTREGELSGIQDVREKCETVKRHKKTRQERNFFGILTPRERIRRIYRKKAAAYKPLPLSEAEAKEKSRFRPERVMFYTAREMEQEMMREKKREMEKNAKSDNGHQLQEASFAEIYEKARYSDEPCSSLDVKHMKELCR